MSHFPKLSKQEAIRSLYESRVIGIRRRFPGQCAFGRHTDRSGSTTPGFCACGNPRQQRTCRHDLRLFRCCFASQDVACRKSIAICRTESNCGGACRCNSLIINRARLAKLADAPDLGSGSARSVGSSPSSGIYSGGGCVPNRGPLEAGRRKSRFYGVRADKRQGWLGGGGEKTFEKWKRSEKPVVQATSSMLWRVGASRRAAIAEFVGMFSRRACIGFEVEPRLVRNPLVMRHHHGITPRSPAEAFSLGT
jgi:hypothetical protein